MELKNNKKMLQTYLKYLRVEDSGIYSRYKTPSESKLIAYDYCLYLKDKYKGYHGKIVSHNTFIFTYGFICDINGKRHFIYITPEHEYMFEIPPEL